METAPARPEEQHDRLLAELAWLDAQETERAEKSLHYFMRMMWPVVEPAQPFIDNWHIGAACEHLQALLTGQIQNLLWNVPPGTSKSLTGSVLFPAWTWAKRPDYRFMCLSFDQGLSTRDSVRMRELVEDERYQRRWKVELADDANNVMRFNTLQKGYRISTSFGGRILGEHPNGKIVDDPHNPKKGVLSENEMLAAINTWKYQLAMRGKAIGAWTLLIMQRLHEGDLAGHVLSHFDGWTHLCLPMKYEPPVWVDLGGGQRVQKFRMPTTPLGFQDPRTTAGELLWPELWTPEKVEDAIKNQLGDWGEAGQFQQRPEPQEGLMFKEDWIKETSSLKALGRVVRRVRFWDVAGTPGGTGPRTAGVRMAETDKGKFVIEHVVKDRLDDDDVNTLIHDTAEQDGKDCPIREEKEGGSAGPAVTNARARSFPGYDYDAIKPDKDKPGRARPLRTQAKAGNLYFLVTDDAERRSMEEFVAELKMFPRGVLKDQVDAASGAFNALVDIALLEMEDEPTEIEGTWGRR